MGEASGDLQASAPADEAVREPDDTPSGLEIEVKFRTDREGLSRAIASPLLGAPSPARTRTLRSIYFDTKDKALVDRGVVLRVRKTGRAPPLMCVKFAGNAESGPFQRREFETRVPQMVPEISMFDESVAEEVSRILEGRPLEAQFETVIRRRTRLVETSRSVIEVAFDEGRVATPGGQRIAVCEVELELKSGDEAGLYELAAAIAGDLPLRLDFESKAEKGFALTSPERSSPVRAAEIVLAEAAPLDTAVLVVVSNTLAQFAGNWSLLRRTEHDEAVHQLRVALRRMRSALKMFRRALPCTAFDDLEREARRIAAALGPAREWDIFCQSIEQGPQTSADCPPACAPLVAAAEKRRTAAYGQARDLIEAEATTLFVLRVQRLLTGRAWRSGLAANASPFLAMSARDFAREALDRLRDRSLKRGKDLMKLTDEERHRLRIALKDMRYGIEFFSSLFGRGKELRSHLKSVSKLQDLLGAHNDVVSLSNHLEDLAKAVRRDGGTASGFVLGWFARGVPIADAHLAGAWKKFKRQERFWR